MESISLSHLFSEYMLGDLKLRNRLVRSATFDGMASSKGFVTDKQISFFSELSAGGVGLIITGGAFVSPSGQLGDGQLNLATDEVLEGLALLTKEVHRHGAKILLQLFHGGRVSQYIHTLGLEPLAPSLVREDPFFQGAYSVLGNREIMDIIKAFGAAGRRAKDAGFDGVQIHAAHGFLFSQFLSPHTNQRLDRWGGSLDNRLRIHKQVYDAVNRAAGEFPVHIKLGVEDGFPSGLQREEGIHAARLLADHGYASIEVSLGLHGNGYENTEYRTGIMDRSREAYFLDLARAVKRSVDIPVVVVGGLRSTDLMESIIEQKAADLVALSRPLIREPDLVSRWQKGEQDDPVCTSCNLCLEHIIQGHPVCCVLDREIG